MERKAYEAFPAEVSLIEQRLFEKLEDIRKEIETSGYGKEIQAIELEDCISWSKDQLCNSLELWKRRTFFDVEEKLLNPPHVGEYGFFEHVEITKNGSLKSDSGRTLFLLDNYRLLIEALEFLCRVGVFKKKELIRYENKILRLIS